MPITRLMLMLAGEKPKPPKAPDLIGPVVHGLEQAFIKFWPLWLLLGLIALGKLAWQTYQLHRLSKSGITEIDQMSGYTFEEYLSTLFRRLDYQVELTRRHGDYGADLVVAKGRTRIAVQAKRWNRKVGLKAVQEAVAAKGMYACDAALVVANREFTEQAKKLARANRVELWGRAVLVEKLLLVRDNEASVKQLEHGPAAPTDPPVAPPALATRSIETMPATPSTPAVAAPPVPTAESAPIAPATCVTCGATVTDKVRVYCEQHSKRFGGRIYCFKHQRGVRSSPSGRSSRIHANPSDELIDP